MTKLDIFNLALAQLPHDRSVDSEEDTSTEAVRCTAEGEPAVVKVLSGHDWNFLTTQLPVVAGRLCALYGDGNYAYPRPAECLRVLGLYDASGRKLATYAVDGMFVAREPAAFVRYLRDVRDPDRWPPLVRTAVVMELARRLCPLITGDRRRSLDLQNAATVAFLEAVHADSHEVAGGGTDGRTYARARL